MIGAVQGIKKIYLDMDQVIFNTLKCIVDLYNEDFSYYDDYNPVLYEDIKSYGFKECALASSEYLSFYFSQPRFFHNVEPMAGAKEVLEKLQKSYPDMVVVSHGTQANFKLKKKWLQENLPTVGFIGVPNGVTKATIDMSDGIFIDDLPRNLLESNAPIKICFGEIFPWTTNWKGLRCKNWQEVYELLGEDD